MLNYIGRNALSIQSLFKCKIAECTCGFGSTNYITLDNYNFSKKLLSKSMYRKRCDVQILSIYVLSFLLKISWEKAGQLLVFQVKNVTISCFPSPIAIVISFYFYYFLIIRNVTNTWCAEVLSQAPPPPPLRPQTWSRQLFRLCSLGHWDPQLNGNWVFKVIISSL